MRGKSYEQLTSNCLPYPLCPLLFLLLRFTIATRMLVTAIEVSPHVMYSSSASWMNEYWAYIHQKCISLLIWSSAHRPLTHLCLHHQCSLLSHLTYESINIQRVFQLHSLQHAVQNYEGPRAADTCTAVDYERWTIVVGKVFSDSLDELNETGFVCWHSMVGPCWEVEVCYCQRICIRPRVLLSKARCIKPICHFL